MTKEVWPASDVLLRSLCLLQTGLPFTGPYPNPHSQEAVAIRQMNTKHAAVVMAGLRAG